MMATWSTWEQRGTWEAIQGQLNGHSGLAGHPTSTEGPRLLLTDRQQWGWGTLPTNPSRPLVSRWQLGETGRTSNLTLATVGSVPSSESKKMAQSLGKRSWENLNICPNNQQSLTSKKVKWVFSKAALVAYPSSIIGDSLFLCSI